MKICSELRKAPFSELPKVDVARVSSVETLQSASSTQVEVKGESKREALTSLLILCYKSFYR